VSSSTLNSRLLLIGSDKVAHALRGGFELLAVGLLLTRSADCDGVGTTALAAGFAGCPGFAHAPRAEQPH
jgi:hypothetical protein